MQIFGGERRLMSGRPATRQRIAVQSGYLHMPPSGCDAFAIFLVNEFRRTQERDIVRFNTAEVRLQQIPVWEKYLMLVCVNFQ